MCAYGSCTAFSVLFLIHQLRQLATGGDIAKLQSAAPGIQAFASISPNAPSNANAGPQPDDKGKKAKKAKDMQSVVASKISMLSGKHTEIMSLDAKVKDSDKLLPGLIGNTL